MSFFRDYQHARQVAKDKEAKRKARKPDDCPVEGVEFEPAVALAEANETQNEQAQLPAESLDNDYVRHPAEERDSVVERLAMNALDALVDRRASIIAWSILIGSPFVVGVLLSTYATSGSIYLAGVFWLVVVLLSGGAMYRAIKNTVKSHSRLYTYSLGALGFIWVSFINLTVAKSWEVVISASVTYLVVYHVVTWLQRPVQVVESDETIVPKS